MNKPIEPIAMNNINAAFVQAQKAFAPALKGATNPHFKSKYADLAACVEAVIDALNANGIALQQHTFPDEKGITVETVFLHESGDCLTCGKLWVPAPKNDPQGFGSALTYARRYSLMAACGIAPEDDDGNAASKKKPTSVARNELESMSEEEQQFLRDLAIEVLACWPDEQATFDAYKKAKANLDTDEQTAFWALFDSKQRSAIKRIGQLELAGQA